MEIAWLIIWRSSLPAGAFGRPKHSDDQNLHYLQVSMSEICKVLCYLCRSLQKFASFRCSSYGPGQENKCSVQVDFVSFSVMLSISGLNKAGESFDSAVLPGSFRFYTRMVLWRTLSYLTDNGIYLTAEKIRDAKH
jgi:hypothetical protein